MTPTLRLLRSFRPAKSRPAKSRPSSSSDAPEPLAAVRDALIEDARRRARALIEDADDEARDTLGRAQAEAHRILAEASADGQAAAERVAARDLTRARADAQALVLAARRRAYEDVRRRSVDGLVRRRSTPELAGLADRLGELAGARVGRGGGAGRRAPGEIAVAELGGERAVVRADALVDHVLADAADEVRSLWA